MNRCKTCKWWDKSAETADYPPDHAGTGLGECTRVMRLWEALIWTDGAGDDEYQVLRNFPGDPLFFTQDGSQYRAELYTLPDFGCVHHEEK